MFTHWVTFVRYASKGNVKFHLEQLMIISFILLIWSFSSEIELSRRTIISSRALHVQKFSYPIQKGNLLAWHSSISFWRHFLSLSCSLRFISILFLAFTHLFLYFLSSFNPNFVFLLFFSWSKISFRNPFFVLYSVLVDRLYRQNENMRKLNMESRGD